MNKISSILEYPQIRLEYIRRQRLGSFWKNTVLNGQFWRLYHNTEAGAGVFINNRKIELMPDKLYLIQPQCGLRTWCDGDPIQLFLHFDVSQITGRNDFPLFELPLTPAAKNLVDMIYDRMADNALPSDHVKILGISLAALAMALLPETAFIRFNADARIEAVCDHIRRNISQTLDVESLARRVKISVNTLLRNFHENTGVTPHQYLLNLRYSKAAQLLENTNIPIDDICESIGVHDRFHFSRTFKKIYGEAPAAYRKSREESGSFNLN